MGKKRRIGARKCLLHYKARKGEKRLYGLKPKENKGWVVRTCIYLSAYITQCDFWKTSTDCGEKEKSDLPTQSNRPRSLALTSWLCMKERTQSADSVRAAFTAQRKSLMGVERPHLPMTFLGLSEGGMRGSYGEREGERGGSYRLR